MYFKNGQTVEDLITTAVLKEKNNHQNKSCEYVFVAG